MSHILTDEGECVPWCPMCGPPCEHGENSYECVRCAELSAADDDDDARREVPWLGLARRFLEKAALGLPPDAKRFAEAAIEQTDAALRSLATSKDVARIVAENPRRDPNT